MTIIILSLTFLSSLQPKQPPQIESGKGVEKGEFWRSYTGGKLKDGGGEIDTFTVVWGGRMRQHWQWWSLASRGASLFLSVKGKKDTFLLQELMEVSVCVTTVKRRRIEKQLSWCSYKLCDLSNLASVLLFAFLSTCISTSAVADSWWTVWALDVWTGGDTEPALSLHSWEEEYPLQCTKTKLYTVCVRL